MSKPKDTAAEPVDELEKAKALAEKLAGENAKLVP